MAFELSDEFLERYKDLEMKEDELKKFKQDLDKHNKKIEEMANKQKENFDFDRAAELNALNQTSNQAQAALMQKRKDFERNSRKEKEITLPRRIANELKAYLEQDEALNAILIEYNATHDRIEALQDEYRQEYLSLLEEALNGIETDYKYMRDITVHTRNELSPITNDLYRLIRKDLERIADGQKRDKQDKKLKALKEELNK